MIPWRRLPVVFVSLFVVSCASPSTPSVGSQTKQFIERPENRAAVKQIVDAQWNIVVGTPCAVIRPTSWDVEISDPLQFDAQGNLLKGVWKEIVTGEGCGAHKIFNVVLATTSAGSVKRVGMLPGTSRADVLLERDASLQARLGAYQVVSRDCKQMAIIDTAFIALEGTPSAVTLPGRDPHPWREEWTIRACDVTAIVTVHFAPDATGTAIQVGLNETRRG